MSTSRRTLAIVAILLTACSWLVDAPAANAALSTDAQRSTDLLNGERRARGLPSLAVDLRLVTIASSWSAHMASTGVLAHNPSVSTLLPSGWTRWAENVGYGGTVDSVHTALMNSAGHRANLLEPDVDAVGIGVVRSGTWVWVTQVFMQHRSLVTEVTTVGSGPGYRLVTAAGAVTTFADAPGLPGIVPASPLVGGAATPSGLGLWAVDAAGRVHARGDAKDLGGLGGTPLSAPIVGMAPTPTGRGYWLLGRDGGVFSFGDATFFGSTGAMRLNQPVVGMAATPTGRGYWFVAADGGIFSFGDALFAGSTGAMRLNQPIVGMAARPTGGGYWLVARDGGIFAFGGAPFHGSTGAMRLNQPIIGMAVAAGGRGYRFVAADGGVFSFGDAPFRGSLGAGGAGSPVVAMLGAA